MLSLPRELDPTPALRQPDLVPADDELERDQRRDDLEHMSRAACRQRQRRNAEEHDEEDREALIAERIDLSPSPVNQRSSSSLSFTVFSVEEAVISRSVACRRSPVRLSRSGKPIVAPTTVGRIRSRYAVGTNVVVALADVSIRVAAEDFVVCSVRRGAARQRC